MHTKDMPSGNNSPHDRQRAEATASCFHLRISHIMRSAASAFCFDNLMHAHMHPAAAAAALLWQDLAPTHTTIGATKAALAISPGIQHKQHSASKN